jgi:hypothetical protein
MWWCAGRSMLRTVALAREIEQKTNGRWKRCAPHRNAGPNSLHIISPIPDRRKGILFTKRQTDMPSEQKMQLFTPELYRRFNSRDEAEALAADAEWEQAITRYGAHLAKFQEKMPSQVAQLSELCLHDGEILLRQEPAGNAARCTFS